MKALPKILKQLATRATVKTPVKAPLYVLSTCGNSSFGNEFLNSVAPVLMILLGSKFGILDHKC